jgi:uncharacterized SAM-binding protein YcdF (DUF218 family)
MLLFLTKLLPVFAYPLGAALLLGLAVLALLFTRFHRAGRALLALALLALWIPATPVFANWISLELELRYPPQAVDALPERDVVILLGGFLGQPLPPRVTPDFSEGADRAMLALRLYRAGKGKVIVVTGGELPWSESVAPEAELIADFLAELGVPRSAIVVETKSRNTYENGANVAALFKQRGWRNGLLVTTGMHMPRAVAVFRRAGVDVTPAAADIHGRSDARLSLLGFLPSARSLDRSTLAIKELFGIYAYRWLDWA